MKKYLTLRNGRKILLNTPEEEAAINAGIAADPDSRPYTDEEWEAVKPLIRRGRPPAENPKVHTGLRLDADVLEAFKAGGKGWQTRINEALKDWLKTHRAA
jgi:uncharacterized protein (DUF4415 family)